MSNVVVVKTGKYIAYVVGGIVTLAKSAITGRFVKRADVQWIIDGMVNDAVKACTGDGSIRHEREFEKSRRFFGVNSVIVSNVTFGPTSFAFKKYVAGVV